MKKRTPAKATMTQVRRAAEKVGATIDLDEFGSYNVDAPAGFIWKANGCHALCQAPFTPEVRMHEVHEDALERIAYGIEPCTEKDCENCEENGVTR